MQGTRVSRDCTHSSLLAGVCPCGLRAFSSFSASATPANTAIQRQSLLQHLAAAGRSPLVSTDCASLSFIYFTHPHLRASHLTRSRRPLTHSSATHPRQTPSRQQTAPFQEPIEPIISTAHRQNGFPPPTLSRTRVRGPGGQNGEARGQQDALHPQQARSSKGCRQRRWR